MIEQVHGNLLDADVDALVNTVNTVGVMGKGIALQFKKRTLATSRRTAKHASGVRCDSVACSSSTPDSWFVLAG